MTDATLQSTPINVTTGAMQLGRVQWGMQTKIYNEIIYLFLILQINPFKLMLILFRLN